MGPPQYGAGGPTTKCGIIHDVQPEAKLLKGIQKLLNERGARAFKIHGDDNFQEVGIPDLLCCYRGRFVGLEVKMPGNKPSPVQKVVLNEIVSAGGYASVVSTVGEVQHLLAVIDWEVGRVPEDVGARRRRILDRSIAGNGK